ncbi:MAG: hypothetical protein A2Y73_01360 [Chloroflexi bacterium RBG_13_56_8]|nr:MAG: hypothetical protein A2Y73_01360 [Chloroflexi bacterium RBG_13_56_8]
MQMFPYRQLLKQIRQNHALEHAIMHILSYSSPPLRLIGRSDWNGLWLYGEVETSAVERAAQEALLRLKNNESWLAVHPRCGTNLAISALLAGGAGFAAASLPTRSRFRRFGVAFLAGILGLALSRPLGLATQRHITTSAELADVRIETVRRQFAGNIPVHRILVTRDEQ